MNHDLVRVLLLGNSFGARVQLPALEWAGGSRVVGLAGANLERAKATAEAWRIPHVTDRWQDLLEVEADLVLVSTPVDLHREMTLACLERGLAVLCEKPFALDTGEAVELEQAAQGKAAWIDHELRWNPCLARMRELVHEGYLGNAWYAELGMFLPPSGIHERPYKWWYDAQRGGGMLGALGSHAVDLLRWLLGEVADVRCELATFVGERPDASGAMRNVTADEHAHLHLRFENGALADVLTTYAVPRERFFTLQLIGSERVLRLADDDRLEGGELGKELSPIEVSRPLPTCSDYGMDEYGIFGRSLPLFLKDVVRAVAAGETYLEHAADFSDGVAVQRVLDAARRSHSDDLGWVSCR